MHIYVYIKTSWRVRDVTSCAEWQCLSARHLSRQHPPPLLSPARAHSVLQRSSISKNVIWWCDIFIWWCDIFIWWYDTGYVYRMHMMMWHIHMMMWHRQAHVLQRRCYHRAECMCTVYIWWCDIFIWWCDISIRVTAKMLSQSRGYVYSIHMRHQHINMSHHQRRCLGRHRRAC